MKKIMQDVAHTEQVGIASNGSKRKRTTINALSVLMATAKRQAAGIAAHKAAGGGAASKKCRKSKQNAFEVIMANAKIPGIFEAPTDKRLPDGCKNMANLVRAADKAKKEAKQQNDHDDDDEDDSDDEECNGDDGLVFEASLAVKAMCADRRNEIEGKYTKSLLWHHHHTLQLLTFLTQERINPEWVRICLSLLYPRTMTSATK
jgi:hypothetical protein